MRLGERHFDAPLNALDGERIVWEGAASRRGMWAIAIRFAIALAVLAAPFGFGIWLALVRNASELLVVPGLATIVLGVLTLCSCKALRSSWYVVTNERICIQSGAVQRTLVTLDLDKIVSVKSSQGWLDRKLGIHSVELLHQGQNSAPPKGAAALFHPFRMQCLPVSEDVLTRLVNEWLPRDNRA